MKTFPNKILTKSQAEQALDTAVALVRQNLPLYTDHCQNHSSVHDIYPQCENNQWTCGFWPGEVWLSYERSRDAAFKNTALTLVDSFLYRIENKIEVDHHDMGFLYSPSCVAAWKLTGSEKGRRAAILAADQLLHPLSSQAAASFRHGVRWALKTTTAISLTACSMCRCSTGPARPRAMPIMPSWRTAISRPVWPNSIRPDGSTYHTFFMNPGRRAGARRDLSGLQG